MYAMVDSLANVYHNVNQVYMAGLMTGSMVLIELPLMRAMYPLKRLNVIVMAIGVLALAGFFGLIRQQAVVGDGQFLRSMIPHHSGAILMCEQAALEDVEIKTLCREIIASQQSEIDLMKRKLRDMTE
jgi:hypothetical protein